MQSEDSLKREFLKKWLMGLQKFNSSKENMSLMDRKNAIKLSADLAMASTRNKNKKGRRSSWSHALISRASRDSEMGFLAKRILDSGQGLYYDSIVNATTSTTTRRLEVGVIRSHKKKKKKKVVSKRIKEAKNSTSYKVRARVIAKRLVEKRTQILKGLVPGGESMDEYSLIKEALDYIVSLRAQVDVMHCLATSISSSSTLVDA